MGEPETKIEGEGNQQQQQQQHDSDENVRNHPAFRAVTKQLKEMQSQLSALQAERENSVKEAERKKAEQEGNYEKARAQLMADLEKERQEKENLSAAHKLELINRDIKTALIKAGATNDLFINGALLSYEGDETGIDEYIKKIVESPDNAFYFSTEKRLNPSAPKIVPGSKGQSSLEERVKKGDVSAMREMLNQSLTSG